MRVGAEGREATIAALRAQAEAMTGSEALPRTHGDVTLSEPWQGRAVALALETLHGLELPWEDFRRQLIAAIADDPDRPYYSSWLVALEQFVIDHGGAVPETLMAHRMRAAAYRTDEAGRADLEVFPIAADEPTLLSLLTEVFEEWWPHIRFGPLINGAVYELRPPRRPDLSMLDGYLTIGFDSWHVHLCIGEHRGRPGHEVDAALARRRRCAHAELQRQWIDGAPRTWMFRMFNGEGAQQLTILLPNPFLDDDQRVLDEPDWARLSLWDHLRDRFLGLPPDPVDRSGDGFRHL
jgi:Nitrile hydratase beta subunit, N-terminal